MRVIGGRLRSRRLLAPAGADTRPTSDRLRETLFNMLAPRMDGARVLDLYSGTGAIGIEALSRGAAHAVFAERAPAALAALRANLQALSLGAVSTVHERAVAAVLGRLTDAPGRGASFDVVILDPPYDAEAERTATLSLLGSLRGASLLAPGALVVAEHATRMPLAEHFGRLRRTRLRKQGDATLSFYEVPVAEYDAAPDSARVDA